MEENGNTTIINPQEWANLFTIIQYPYGFEPSHTLRAAGASGTSRGREGGAEAAPSKLMIFVKNVYVPHYIVTTCTVYLGLISTLTVLESLYSSGIQLSKYRRSLGINV